VFGSLNKSRVIHGELKFKGWKKGHARKNRGTKRKSRALVRGKFIDKHSGFWTHCEKKKNSYEGEIPCAAAGEKRAFFTLCSGPIMGQKRKKGTNVICHDGEAGMVKISGGGSREIQAVKKK